MMSLNEALQSFQDRSLNTQIDAKAKRMINDIVRQDIATSDLPYNYGVYTFLSEADMTEKTITPLANKVISVSFKNSQLIRTLLIVNSLKEFNTYRVSSMSNNFPFVCYFDSKKLHFYPKLSSDNVTEFYVNYLKKVPEITFPDTTVSGVTVTEGSRTVTGTGFLSSYVGKYLKTSNNIWYEIEEVTSSTSMILTTEYAEATATTTVTVAALLPYPDGFELMPIYEALSEYFMSDENKIAVVDRWKARSQELRQQYKEQFNTPTDNIAGLAEAVTSNIPGFYVYR